MSRSGRSAAARSSPSRAVTAAPQSRAMLMWLGGSFVVTFLVLLALVNANVRFGEGFFAYRYSPVRNPRTIRMLPLALVTACACAAVAWLARTDPKWRRRGMGMLVVTMLSTTVWIWCAPPAAMNQHGFVMRSPSSDGAFVTEAEKVQSVRGYLRGFDERLERSVEEMRGTRVLSNPPGMTLLAYAVEHGLAAHTGWIERMLVEDYDLHPDNTTIAANSLRAAGALVLIWALSGVVAYALGRIFLSPAGAALFAIVVTFNPCTAHFVPGKDPAQLLTINAMLWAWLAGWKNRSQALCGLAGAVFVIGATFGLIHIWIALAVFIATVWQEPRAIRLAIPAAIGALIVCVIAYVTLNWNIPLTLLAVTRRWTQLQSTFHMSRATWYLIGLPIFLLFVSPALWAMLGLTLRRKRWNFGTRLATCTAAIMMLIYFAIGMTYELPRLWVAFLPPLVLGLATDQPLLRSPGEHRRAARALMTIVIAHFVFTALHWTIFDAREAEYRLFTKRYFD